MKNIYTQFVNLKLTSKFFLVIIVLAGFPTVSSGQIIKPFTQRTSSYSPSKKIYNIKGDYTMIGNTNLTLNTYGENTNNSNNTMVYVDVDGVASTLNSSSANLTFSTENGAIPSCSNIIYAGLYWTGRSHDATSPNTFTVTKNSVTKTYNKQIVSLKGPGSSTYTDITANASDIYYPTTTDGYMYSAYAEVTDYVKTHGIGDYTVADIALREGNGGGTGYYGGWGMVVVYENSKMNWRDVTLFDGHAYVQGSTTTSYELPISGFNTVQAGNVNMKLGMMAGEGDVGISGDYFQIINQSNSWVSLNHAGNTATNFFNGSIQTEGNSRTPNLKNNTGLDIAMFNIPNANNNIITNNQTSTRFRYGSTQDTYIIFCIAMAVDAYIPYPEGLNTVQSINNLPPGSPLLIIHPDDDIVIKVELRNKGAEAINNTKIVIPVPYTASYVNSSKSIYYTPVPSPNNLYFDPSLGANGSVVWDLGTLPKSIDINTLLADLSITFKATNDCGILTNSLCSPKININGTLSGKGAISGTEFSDVNFISGHKISGTCVGEPITEPISINFDATQYVAENCQGTPPIRSFTYCNVGPTIPITDVNGYFPVGSRFYDAYPVNSSTIEFTISNPFPATSGTKTYFAVPPGDDDCYSQFTITINNISTVPSVNNINYCQDEAAIPLTATPSNPDYILYYYTTAIEGTPQTSIIPSTATAGSTTYYVAEGPSGQCISPNRASINVNVRETPVCSISGVDENVCTSTPTIYSAPEGMSGYSWSVTGNGSVAGSSSNQTVTILTGTECNSSFIITLTTTNGNGCSSVCTKEISVNDTEIPVIMLTDTTSLDCNPTPSQIAAAFGTASVVDNCSVGLVDTGTLGAESGSGCSFSTTKTWTVTDGCGNVGLASQTVTYTRDTISPVIGDLPDHIYISCSEIPTFTPPIVTDNCDDSPVLTFVDDSLKVEITHKYSLFDSTAYPNPNVGNIGPGFSSLEVGTIFKSNINGYITGFKYYKGAGTEGVHIGNLWSITGTNLASAAFTNETSEGWQSVNLTLPVAISANSLYVISYFSPHGDFVKTDPYFTVDISNGPLTALGSTDDQPNGNYIYNSTSTFPYNHTFVNSPNYWADVIFSTNPDTNSVESYTITRTWTASDACGNISDSVSQTITFEPVTPPIISALPSPSTIICPSVPEFTIPTAKDGCENNLPVYYSDVKVQNECSGSYSVTRTWTASDAFGNSSTASQIINVLDNVAPVIAELPGETTIYCPAEPEFAAATASDECGSGAILTFVDVKTGGSCAGSYSVTRTWTAQDACGNTSTAVQTINVEDIAAPVLSEAPANVTVDCIDIPVAATLTAQDNCDASPQVTFTEVRANGNCPNSYTLTRTWMATDACGNISSTSQLINVLDQTAPVLSPVPADTAVECNSIALLTSELVVNGDFAKSTPPFAFSNGYVYQPDIAGNMELYPEGRFAVGPDALAYHNDFFGTGHGGAGDNFLIVNGFPGATQPIVWKETITGLQVGTIYYFSAWARSLNDAGNYANLKFSINGSQIGVPTGPLPAGPANNLSPVNWIRFYGNWTANSTTAVLSIVDLSTAAAGNDFGIDDISFGITVTATDNCDNAPVVTFTEARTDGNCLNNFTLTRTWTAKDACGNESSKSQVIQVKDVTAPVIEALPSISTIQCPSTPVFAVASVTDGCDANPSLTYSDTKIDGDCVGSYSVTRTWIATDACGNTSTAAQTINVQDITAPVIAALPAPTTIDCPAVPEFASATATDDCGSAFTLTFDDVKTDGDCAGSYSVTRTWTAQDACGNIATASQTISVQDITAPVIAALPAPTTIDCPAVPEFATATATDDCGSAFTLTFDDVKTDGDCAGSYSVTRTWTAKDACGNTSTASQTINVQDITAPVIAALPAPTTIDCPAVPEFASATATDDCGSAFTLTFDDVKTDGDCAGSYSVTRTWTAKDACGNTSTASQTINVQDITAPVIAALPAPTTIDCPAVPEFASATATDDCESAFTLTFNDVKTDGDCAGSYSITRTWTAKDACGNTSTASQTITVQDVKAPILSEAPANVTVECNAVPDAATLTATDNCDAAPVVTFTEVRTNGTCPNSYTLTRTWTATDACLNTSTVSQVVTVQNVSTPVLTCPANITVNNDPGVCGATITVPKPSVSVNCGSYSLSNSVNQTADASGLYPIGTTTVEWTVSDECGNTSKCSMTVTVTDNEKPVITCPSEITICSGEQVILGTATATDNCGITSITNNAPATFEPGTTQVVWTATDNHGNTSTCTQTVTITPMVTADAGPDAPLCSGLSYTLSGATAANYASVSWTHNGHGSLSNADILNPVYTPSAGESGAIEFTLTAKGTSGCGSMEATDKFILTISPAIAVNAGNDKTIISGTATSLAGSVSGGTGVLSYSWTPAEYLVNNTSLTPTTLPLNNETVFTLTAIDAISGCSASDEVKISIDDVARPIARDDYDTASFIPSVIDVMANDSDPVGFGLTITITTNPKNGTAVLNEDGTITYTLLTSANGNDTLTYTICDKGSPSKCATAKVIITIIPLLPVIEIYNLVTPNGDGQNDFWHIDGIEGFPENEIIIFNRWGDKVHEFKGYNNNGNHWTGTNEKNEFLPDGVYFYLIKLNDESITPNTYTGWVYVRGKGGN